MIGREQGPNMKTATPLNEQQLLHFVFAKSECIESDGTYLYGNVDEGLCFERCVSPLNILIQITNPLEYQVTITVLELQWLLIISRVENLLKYSRSIILFVVFNT